MNYLPTDIVGGILNAFPDATLQRTLPVYRVDCSLRDVKASIDFTLGGTTIRVPYKEFIWQPYSDICLLTVMDDKGKYYPFLLLSK